MWSLLLIITGLPVVISSVIIEGRAIEISFDWSVSCPPTPSGIVNLTTVVSFYNSIEPDLFNPEFSRRLAGTETLSYTSHSSSSHFHKQHHHLQIPQREKCLIVNGGCRIFGFRWSSVLLSSHNDTTNCCWSVSNVTISSINKYDPNSGINYQSVVDICYQQQPYQYNNMPWVCPNNNTDDEDSGLVQFESDIIEYVISTDNPSFHVQSSCSNIVASHNYSGLPHHQILSPSSSMPPSPSSVSVMIPLSTPLPDPMCVADGVWPQTKAGTNVTLSREVKECFNGTVEASRSCGSNGEWNNVICLSSSTFKMTLEEIMESPVDGLVTLQEILPEVPLVQSVFLFSTALNTVLETSDNVTISRQLFTEIFLNITDILISGSANDEFITRDIVDTTSAGSQLLVILDRVALELAPANEQTETEELTLKVLEFNDSVTIDSSITSIEDNENNSITLPQEIFTPGNKIRVGSFLFHNLSHLLPPVNTNSSIISPIISSTIDCQSCPVTNLTQNVTIQLRIEKSSSSNEILECVFFDFKIRDGLLPTGDWSTSGCTTVTVDGDLVTCSCNHLTHFAILLSPGGPEISPIHYKVLTTIGLVLVPISLLCMVMVILTYSLIRSLWSLRNYVHIMLCVSLFMAQLVFIIGVDKIENQGVCSAVAVILVYLFLVTFMWMLMEGVVLYVTLVRVFITNHKYYAISFTVASYVIPAVYMAVIIPIGYLINVGDIPGHTHFLYYRETDDDNVPSLTACWVNYSTGFIWSFIAPVIVIILANVGFFMMALVVAKRHSTSKQSIGTKIRQWILAVISLTVVMGIAWLVGVMAFRRELLPVAYITAIFIAAQGIILFVILVPLSYQARKAYGRMWAKKKRILKANFSNFSSPFSATETKQSTLNIYSAPNTLSVNPNTLPGKEFSLADNVMPEKSNILPADHPSPSSAAVVGNGCDNVTATTKSHPIHKVEQVDQCSEEQTITQQPC